MTAGRPPALLDGLRLGLLLWRVQLRMLRNRVLRRPRWWQILGALVAVPFLVFIWVQAVLIAFFLLEGLPRLSPGTPLDQVLSLAFFGYFVLLLFSSALFTLNALLLNPDLDLLLASPRPMESVLVAKVLLQVLNTSGLSLLVAFPALLAAAGVQRQPLAVALLALLLAAYPLIPTAMISLLVLALVRFVPASRAREVIAALGFLFAAGINVLNLMLNPALRPHDAGRTSQLLPTIPLAYSPALPSGWAGRAAAGALTGAWPAALAWTALLVAIAGLVFFLTTAAGARLYVTGWTQVAGRRRGLRLPRTRRQSRLRLPGLSGPVAAVVSRDWRMRRRDLSELARLAMPLGFLAALFGLNWRYPLIVVPKVGPGPLAALLGLAPALLIIFSMSSSLGLSALSFEGRAIWIFAASPNSVGRLLEAKCWGAALPVVGVALAAGTVVETIVRPGWVWAAGALALVAVQAGALSVIMVAVGSVWARFDWTDARRMTHPAAALVGTFLQFALAGATVLLAIGPLLLASALRLPLLPLWLLGMALAAIMAAGLAILALLLAYERLLRLEF